MGRKRFDIRALLTHLISVSDSVLIDAPVERVYEYMDDPHNHEEVTPSVSDVRNVEPLENAKARLELADDD